MALYYHRGQQQYRPSTYTLGAKMLHKTGTYHGLDKLWFVELSGTFWPSGLWNWTLPDQYCCCTPCACPSLPCLHPGLETPKDSQNPQPFWERFALHSWLDQQWPRTRTGQAAFQGNVDEWHSLIVWRRMPIWNVTYPCSPETLPDLLSYSSTLCLSSNYFVHGLSEFYCNLPQIEVLLLNLSKNVLNISHM